jgi:hypothetical protein
METCLNEEKHLILAIATQTYDTSPIHERLNDRLKLDTGDFFIYLLFGSFTVGSIFLSLIFLWTDFSFIKPIYAL